MRHFWSAVVSILGGIVGFSVAIIWYVHVINEANAGRLTDGGKVLSMITIVVCLVGFLAIVAKIGKKIDPEGITFRRKTK